MAAALAYDQASEHFNRGELESAAACLRTAARDPLFRFRAASMLARIARDEGRLHEAIDWLERAAEAPAPTAEASHGLLYELGDVLDSSCEYARALAVFIELHRDGAGLPRCRGSGRQPVASGGRARGAGDGPLVSVLGRLLFLAYFIEVGLVLLVVPWSPFWERNYFLGLWPALGEVTRSNLVRGAVSGLGIINLWAAMAELATLFGLRSR